MLVDVIGDSGAEPIVMHVAGVGVIERGQSSPVVGDVDVGIVCGALVDVVYQGEHPAKGEVSRVYKRRHNLRGADIFVRGVEYILPLSPSCGNAVGDDLGDG